MGFPHQKWIDSATRPLRDLELKLAAEKALAELHSEPTASVPPSDEEARISRWNQIGQKRGGHFKRWIPLVFATLALSLVWSFQFKEALVYLSLISAPLGTSPTLKTRLDSHLDTSRLSGDEKLLLLGDPSRRPGETRKTLWERHPENPAYFADYVGEYLATRGSLPPDFREITRQIDPGNSFFDYLDAALLAKASLEYTRLTRSERESGVPQWIVKDQAKFDEALALVAEAAEKPHFDSYATTIALERALLFPRQTRLDVVSLALNGWFPVLHFQDLGSAFVVQAHALEKANDAARFRQLLENARAFLKKQLHHDSGMLIDQLLLRTTLARIVSKFDKAARTLGLVEISSELEPWNDYVRETDALKTVRIRLYSQTFPFGGRGDFIAAGSLSRLPSFSRSDFPLPDSELIQGSMADHALLARWLSLAMATLLVVLVPVLGLRNWVASPLVSFLGIRFEQQLTPRDYAIISGFGIILPTLILIVLPSFTPLGGRHLSLLRTLMILPSSYFVAWFLLVLVLSIITTRWRIHRRMSGTSLGGTWKSPVGWLVAGLTAIAAPVIGWYILTHEPEAPGAYLLFTAFAPAVIWLLCLSGGPLLGSLQHRMTSSATARALTPLLPCAAMLMTILSLIFKWQDEQHFRNYGFAHFGKNGSPYTEFEAQISRAIRQEMLDPLSP